MVKKTTGKIKKLPLEIYIVVNHLELTPKILLPSTRNVISREKIIIVKPIDSSLKILIYFLSQLS